MPKRDFNKVALHFGIGAFLLAASVFLQENEFIRHRVLLETERHLFVRIFLEGLQKFINGHAT